MIIARQSTARTVTVGPVLDADGVAVTGGVVADFKIAKNGGIPAALNASATLTHRHTGFYSLALTASDLDTVGQAEVVIDDTVNACPMKEVTVLEEAVYDAMFAASAPGYLQPTTAGRKLLVNASGTAGADLLEITQSEALADKFAAYINAFPQFTVASGSTTTSVRSDRLEADNFWNDATILFSTGALAGVVRRVTSYTTANGAFAVATLPSAPSAGDTGFILGRIEDPLSTAVPGSYGAGTVGKIIGDRLVKLGNEAQGGSSATLTLSQLVVSNPSGDAVQFTSTGGNGDGLQIAGNNLGMGIRVDGLTGILVTGAGAGAGIEINGGSISAGLLIRGGGTSGSGVSIVATDGNAITLTGGANGHGMAMTGAGSGEGLRITAGATGNGVEIVAGSTSGVGVQITTTSGDGVDIASTGGVDIDAALASVTVAGSVTGAVGSVTAGVTVTTNSDKTGYALTSGERDSIATALLDLANGVETGKTLRQAMRIVAAICGGKVSGGGTATEIFTGIDGSTVRVTATVEADGDRTAMVYG